MNQPTSLSRVLQSLYLGQVWHQVLCLRLPRSHSPFHCQTPTSLPRIMVPKLANSHHPPLITHPIPQFTLKRSSSTNSLSSLSSKIDRGSLSRLSQLHPHRSYGSETSRSRRLLVSLARRGSRPCSSNSVIEEERERFKKKGKC
jgi:hypothetical protein